MYEISIGLRFLRDFTVVHNDIKPQNVLLKIVSDRNRNNGTFLLRLIDFGESHSQMQRTMNSDNYYRRGYTIPYASPELTLNDKFN
jgi:serine/threonine protein kinase